MRTRWKLLSAILFSLALAGCVPDVKTVCPVVKKYTHAELQKMAAAYPGLPAIAKTFIRDYGMWREICRKIEGSSP